MSEELDLTNRDPNHLNNHIQVSFEDVFAEPEGAHSMDCVWTNSYKCFGLWLGCCYKTLTCLSGICIAIAWGCLFACVTFSEVWLMTPYIRLQNILLTNVGKLYSILLNAFIAPCFETIGMLFSRIHVTSSTGEAPKPLGFLPGEKAGNVKQFK